MLRSSFLMILAATSLATPAKQTTLDVGQSIAKVRSFARSRGDVLWPGYGSAPFEFLLVSKDEEQLICRRSVPGDFTLSGTDPATGCKRYARSRSGLPDSLLAAMPVFGPPSTVVMGTPQSTGRPQADWTRTILHEHFHQWQDSFPKIFDRMAALDLADGDQTGMWMLNYPFPYSDPSVVSAFNGASHSLAAALDARGKKGFGSALRRYLAARGQLARAAGDRNWRYAELELWKEGVARWTEIELGKRYPTADVRKSAFELERNTRAWLDHPDLTGAGREFVYPFGASEAMLLEACGSSWRRDYPHQLSLGQLLEKAARTCGA